MEAKKQEEKKERERILFNQMVRRSLQRHPQTRGRPMPVHVADGRCIDFFELWNVVQSLGGYERVSKEKRWGAVARSLRLEEIVGPSLKLVYAKYLMILETPIQRHSSSYEQSEPDETAIVIRIVVKWLRDVASTSISLSAAAESHCRIYFALQFRKGLLNVSQPTVDFRSSSSRVQNFVKYRQ